MDRQTATAVFPSAATSVAEARRFVRGTLADWGLEGLTDDAVLATSELATNAVAYAGTPFEVSLRLEESSVRIELRDQHATRRFPMPGTDETRGRGLPSTARLASCWGVTYEEDSKAVWFRLAAPGGKPPARPAGLPPGEPQIRRPPVPRHTVRRPDEAVMVKGIGGPDPATIDEALGRAAETARDLLSADGTMILITDAEARFTVGAATGLAVELGSGRLLRTDLGAFGEGEDGAGDPHGGHTPSGGGAGNDRKAWVAGDDGALPPLAHLVGARSLATAPIRVQGRRAGAVVAVASEQGRFDQSAGDRLVPIADEVALVLERARVGELERSWRGWLSFVAEASDLLAGTLDQERTMALVAQLAVPRLASWCAVFSAGETGVDRLEYVWHADETRTDALRDLLRHADPAPSSDAAGPWNGFAAAPSGVRAAAGSLATDVAYCFPLVARGRDIGLILIGRPASDRFPRGVIELAEELSRRAALAIDNARLYAAQTAMSNALQRSLLPPDLPHIPGLEVAVVYEPAGGRAEVGGDFYDVFEAAPDEHGLRCWRFAIGDVCGTGPEAAAVTGLARQALRILAAEGMAVPDVITRLNRLILREGARSRLLTLLHGEITPRADRRGVRLGLVSAGHPLPLVLDPDGQVHEAGTPQRLLGVFDEADFEVDHVELTRGQVLLCVTDGVTERRSRQRLLGDAQGLERLLASCAGLSAGAVAAKVQRAVRDFSPEPSNDDVALIVLRVA